MGGTGAEGRPTRGGDLPGPAHRQIVFPGGRREITVGQMMAAELRTHHSLRTSAARPSLPQPPPPDVSLQGREGEARREEDSDTGWSICIVVMLILLAAFYLFVWKRVRLHEYKCKKRLEQHREQMAEQAEKTEKIYIYLAPEAEEAALPSSHTT
ncbi:hypothetical protein O3P69_006870 [Scylla paramamosain]|uniref:Uncharacterized protein n=1 Tax=Scylla paramamosain TaxID=85552 RepID=A0AAW0U3I1_SCYPA